VGAHDFSGTVTEFSSQGPVTVDGSGRMKPDIAAPGAGVLSAYPGGTYEFADGTSMAGPHVAGVVALLWSANPALIGEVAATAQILRESAQPYTGQVVCSDGDVLPNAAAGYGLLDAYTAVSRALIWQQP
jgi:subtilisin family serine protease